MNFIIFIITYSLYLNCYRFEMTIVWHSRKINIRLCLVKAENKFLILTLSIHYYIKKRKNGGLMQLNYINILFGSNTEFRGFTIGKDLVLLNGGQMTRATLQLAILSLNFHAHKSQFGPSRFSIKLTRQNRVSNHELTSSSCHQTTAYLAKHGRRLL